MGKATTPKDLEKKDGAAEPSSPDFDPNAERGEEVGKYDEKDHQERNARSRDRNARQRAQSGSADDAAAEFTKAVSIIAPAIKQLTDAGMGGGEAGRLALEIFRETCC